VDGRINTRLESAHALHTGNWEEVRELLIMEAIRTQLTHATLRAAGRVTRASASWWSGAAHVAVERRARFTPPGTARLRLRWWLCWFATILMPFGDVRGYR